VKENQKNLYTEIAEYFQEMESVEIREAPEDVWVSALEKGHGRLEKREIRVVTDIGWLSMRGEWKDMKAVIQYRSRRTDGGETTVTDRYYISNLDIYADEFGEYLRGHWSIENRLHWTLDVIFGEDTSGRARGTRRWCSMC
jgi:predicted transposase YbfD/YdcC